MAVKQKKIEKNNRKEIPVVIFCGGRGTRLKEETEIIPKPLVRIGGYPLLWHIMKIYSAHGFRNFILPVGYKGEKIKEYFINHPVLQSDFTIDFSKKKGEITHHSTLKDEWKITIIDTGLEAQTGARLKRIESHITSDVFLLTYGDGVSNVNIRDLLAFHRSHKHAVTVTGVHPPARFGEIEFDGVRVKNFHEKPHAKETYINGGFFVLDRDVFSFLNDEKTLNFEKDVLPEIAREGELAVYCHDGYWQCMDTVRDMEFLNEEWAGGNAAWKMW